MKRYGMKGRILNKRKVRIRLRYKKRLEKRNILMAVMAVVKCEMFIVQLMAIQRSVRYGKYIGKEGGIPMGQNRGDFGENSAVLVSPNWDVRKEGTEIRNKEGEHSIVNIIRMGDVKD